QNGYDDLGRLVRTDLKKQTDADWTFSSFGYDANGNVSDQVQNGLEATPGGTLVKAGRSLHSEYDGANWIATQFDYGSSTPSAPGTDAQRTLTTFTPVGLEQKREIDKPNGSGGWTPKQTTTWQYLANGKLAQLSTVDGTGATLQSHAVGYLDAAGIYDNGNRTSDAFTLQRPAGSPAPCFPNTCTATHADDPRDRLVNQNDGHGSTTAYTLDGSGNILTESVNGSTTRSYTYLGTQLQQVTSGGQTSNYWYDDLGRLHCVTTSA